MSSSKILSFEGRAKKLDSAEDAKCFAEEILASGDIEVLQMNGNTVGREAADVLRDSLKQKGSLKRLIWHDIFTGRSKEVLPPSLKAMMEGVMQSGARLEEINLSDNAFGPAGMEGLRDILCSQNCFTLKELRLNNNGLGTFGAEELAKSLIDGYNNSIQDAMSEPFQLEVFIAGRNRLENPGCSDMAKVFDMMRSLVRIEIPQNGIYADGIRNLASALQFNTNLKILNLSDNTITRRGALPLIEGLKNLPNLEVLNLCDSMIRNKGALKLAGVAPSSWPKLQVLNLGGCEIQLSGGLAVVDSLKNKRSLKSLELSANCFGDEGVAEITQNFRINSVHAEGVLLPINDDEGEKSDDESENNLEELEKVLAKNQSSTESDSGSYVNLNMLESFLDSPNPKTLESFGDNYIQIISEFVQDLLTDSQSICSLFLDISTGCIVPNSSSNDKALKLLDSFLREAIEHHKLNIMRFCDVILEQCGLIKSEMKVKARTNLAGPLIALSYIVKQDYFTKHTRLVLKAFFGKTDLPHLLEFNIERSKLMSTLHTL